LGVVSGHLSQSRGLEAGHDQFTLQILLTHVLRVLIFLVKLIRSLHQVSGVNRFSCCQPAESLIQVQVALCDLGAQRLGGGGDELDQLVAVITAANGLKTGDRLGIYQWLAVLPLREW